MKKLFCTVLIISVLATGCGKGNKNTKITEDTSSGAITVESEVDNKLDDSKEQVEKGVNDVVDKASETISNTGNEVKDAVKGVSESKASGDNSKGSAASSKGGNTKTNSTPKSEKPSSNTNKPASIPTPKPSQPTAEKPTQPSQPSVKPGINQTLTNSLNSTGSLNDYGISKKVSLLNDLTTKIALGQISSSSVKSKIQGLQEWEDTCKINRGNAIYSVTSATVCVFKTSSNNAMDIIGQAMRSGNRPEGNYIYNVAYRNADGTNTIVMLGVILSPFIASN